MASNLLVVHVAETIRGGIATYLRNILPLQVKRYGVGRIGLVIPDGQRGEVDGIQGIEIFTFKSSAVRFQSALRARQCLASIGKLSPQAITHVHSTFAGIVVRAFPVPGLRAERLVYCPHGWAFTRDGSFSWVAALLERLLYGRTAKVVCVSEAERKDALLAGLPGGKLVVIKNGLPPACNVNQAKMATRTDRPLRLVFVGRLDRQKGLDILLDALRLVTVPVFLDVFGAEVLGDAAVADVPCHVKMHGWQPHHVVEAHLINSDVLVMPSRWEAFGFTALEAMRAGIPVIASRVGGLPELIDDGRTGWLVPPSDPGALADAINGLKNKDLRAVGAKGRVRFEGEFSIHSVERKMADVYTSC